MHTDMFYVRNTIYSSIRAYFSANGFVEVAPPILTPFSCESACVGGSDLISVDYYHRKMYLSQSAQLYLEAMALDINKVFCINPAFRAEGTSLITHLSEFWMCEAEFINDSLDALILNIQGLLYHVIKDVLTSPVTGTLATKYDQLSKIINSDLPVITYSDVVSLLQKKGESIFWGEDISKEQEQLLCNEFDSSPIFITNYPVEISSFYKKLSSDQKTVLGVDLVAPHGYGELAGGSIRKNNAEEIRRSLVNANADINNFNWYIELIKKKPLAHSGYGLGIERLLAWLCDLSNIQQAIPYPRTEELVCP